MIYLDKNTDSILPYGLLSTPFEVVYKALQAVAGDVWAVDPSVYRAAIAWGYYLRERHEVLIDLNAGRQYIANILLGEQIPLIKSTQTTSELVDLLAKWRDYTPTFPKLEGLYTPYAATVDIRPITDPDMQRIAPVTDIHGAFYVVVVEIDRSRPLLLEEATLIADRATPMGSRPVGVYGMTAESVEVYETPVFGDACLYLDSFGLPDPPDVGDPLCGSIGPDFSESVLGSLPERMERGGIGFTGLLTPNTIPTSGRVTLSGMAINGELLTPNTIPESGVVEPDI